MRVDIRQRPSFAVARLGLAPGESCRVEAGALHSMSGGLGIHSESRGGLLKSVRRALAGESLFITTYTAPDSGGWVDVAPNLPGDIQVIELDGRSGWCITRGSWIASSDGVELDTKWTGVTMLLNGEGGFLSHATGTGLVLVTCYGALETATLAPGEPLTVGTGHVVAYTDTMECTSREVAKELVESMKGGNGMVFDFVGPGRVLTQTRNPTALSSWVRAKKSSV
ncbi:TIGR00266 family protein [Pseudonocardia acaciae]|uniref:TIGR00266 family protein n=1 Tax=Pseudonocardia acaciae TaxID=551276 RepID=UPI00048DED1E|nr:TIGR00266 family protein [Pseudonocardia acaciae]